MKHKKISFLYVILTIALLIASYHSQLLDLRVPSNPQQISEDSRSLLKELQSDSIVFSMTGTESQSIGNMRALRMVSNQMANNKKVNRVLLEYLHLLSLSEETDNVYCFLDQYETKVQGPKEPITVYIHKSDGKKRI